MNGNDHPASDDEIRGILERSLRDRSGRHSHITGFHRRLSDYRSSFAIEELNLELDDGGHLAVMFKNLSPRALLDVASRTRPQFLYEPLREIKVYETVLASLPLGTAICYATHVDPPRDRYWLFLEKVSGTELYQIGELEVWQDVARWLGRFHVLGQTRMAKAGQARLQIWDRSGYLRDIERAQECVARRHAADSEASRAIRQISRGYERIIDRLAGIPVTVIHGEFFASNILIAKAEPTRVCPIDWETAGIGPGLIDLAALVAGNWSETPRDELAMAYLQGLADAGVECLPAIADFQRDLLCCRLHLAIQLVGRSAEWEPPPEHKRDWLAEAQGLTAVLAS